MGKKGKIMAAPLVISVNDEKVSLTHEEAEHVIWSLPDKFRFRNIMREMSNSPNPEIREDIANREHIDQSTIGRLANDSQIAVLRNIVDNKRAQKLLSEAQVLRLIRTNDAEILETVAKNLDSFSRCRNSVIQSQLLGTDNVKIRIILAEDQDTEKTILEMLCDDSDEEVASKAEDTLEELLEEDEDDEDEEEDED
jgi:hypothetical protein